MYFLREFCNRMLILRTAIMCVSSATRCGSHRHKEPIAQVFTLLLLGIVLGGCEVRSYQTIQGETMGTYYRVVANCNTLITQDLLESEFQLLTTILSTYDSDSEISTFNDSNTVGEWVQVHRILVDVIATAQQVSALTNGAFDITIAPVVELWGFGGKEITKLPAPASITQALQHVNYKLLELDESNQSLRKLSDIRLDLSGIGKGYGVDYVAKILTEHDCSDFLVDIGGEIRVRGHNAVNKPWRVGIEVPDATGQVQTFLGLSDGALATSGSYRNFQIFGQTVYPHVIDPRSGYPTSHNLLAVTVYHATAAEADALATACFVMGFDNALEFAESQEIAIALTTWDSEAEKMRTNYSTAMEVLLKARN